jgi:hypothetical protein
VAHGGETKKPANSRFFSVSSLSGWIPGFGRSDWIRTSDLLVPNETRYQAALRSEDGAHFTEKLLLHKRLENAFWQYEASD